MSSEIKITIIPIAQKKIKRRKIPENWIKETILNPDQRIEGHTGRIVSQRIYR